MGQYWLPVNLDKKEFIDPHQLGSGLKLWEQVAAHPGTGAALLILCASMPERRGGGDLDMDPNAPQYSYDHSASQVIGRWAGDRITLIGDYAKDTDLPEEYRASKIYSWCRDGVYTDITSIVQSVIEHELGGRFEGMGWMRWNDGSGKNPTRGLRPDLVING